VSHSGHSISRVLVAVGLLLTLAFFPFPFSSAQPVSPPDTTGAEVEPDSSSAPRGGGPDTTVVYSARDSLVYDIEGRNMELWGDASIAYDDMKIDAPKIIVDYRTSLFDAFAAEDSSGQLSERPVFTDRDGAFEADHMTYNYSTKKGRTINVSSEIEEGYYSGANVKRLETGELYIRDGIYTTCPKDDPDFWFYGRNMKIIPGDKIVARPLIMYIRPKPFSTRFPAIPLIPLPFMTFPIKGERSSGFLIPSFSNDDRGLYLSNFGYFWALNDYMDLRLESDLAFNGSWRLGERFRYRKRYLFDGYLEGEYERFMSAHPDDPDYVDYSNWNWKLVHHHRFDPTAKLDLNLYYQGGRRYYDVNSINPESIINEQANSYASFSKTYDEGSRSITASYQRTQDLSDDDLTETIGVSYYQGRVYPFRDEGASPDDWRSRFSITPRASASAEYSTVSDLDYSDYTGNASVQFAYQQDFAEGFKANFSQKIKVEGKLDYNPVLDDRWGARVELPFSANTTLFRYFNVNANLDFTSYYLDSSVEQYYDGTEVMTIKRDDMSEYSTWSVGFEAETRLYGSAYTGFLEDLVGIKAMRHTFIPTVSYTYNPDFRSEDYDYYGTYINALAEPVRYNRFQNAVYSNVPGEQSTVGLKLQNLLHAKIAPHDPAAGDRVVQLLSFNAETGYNFAADSLHLSPLVLTASSNALAPNLMFSAGATYDFYDYDEDSGDRIDRFYSESGNGPLRFVNGFLNLSFNLQGKLGDDGRAAKAMQDTGDDEERIVQKSIFTERYDQDYYRENTVQLPWQLRMSLYLNSSRFDPTEDAETTALLNTSARVSLSPVWQLGLSTGYDLENAEIIYPQINLYGDYGCWDMSFQWVPAGEYESYFFQIGIKASHLRDIRFRQAGS